MPNVQERVESLVQSNKVMIFSKSTCPFCAKAKAVFKSMKQAFEVLELNQDKEGPAIQAYLQSVTKIRTVPQVFVNQKCIGGGTETEKLKNSGELAKMLA